jgi:inhibitor of KinA
MALGLLHLNGISWSVFRLGETAWLLQPKVSEKILEHVHSTSDLLEQSKIDGLQDIIPAYDSITLIYDSQFKYDPDMLSDISSSTEQHLSREKNIFEINVCYELGIDWNEVEVKTGLSKEEVISIHSTQNYTLAMMGFMPGFIFLDGLDQRIAVSRKEKPRIKVPSGSVGIGGNQTGIYSLESPGGWQIIGRTTESFFDINKTPPTELKAGDRIRFKPISKEEFDKMVAKNG